MNKSENIKHLCLFDIPRLITGSEVNTKLGSRKAIALLGYLVQLQKPVGRGELATLLWPDKPEANGRNNLSGLLKTLTTHLPYSFNINYHTIQFTPAANTQVDSWQLTQLLAQQHQWPKLLPLALTHLQSETSILAETTFATLIQWNNENGFNQLEQAGRLYSGTFLAGIYLDKCPEYELWLTQTRAYWQQQAIQLWQNLAAYYALIGEPTTALTYLQQWLAAEPWHETGHQLQMRLFARQGQQPKALATYEQKPHSINPAPPPPTSTPKSQPANSPHGQNGTHNPFIS